jgi:high-affinity iron transporter
MVEAGLLSSGIIAPFLVVLRESIEAALIVGIMWAYLDKIERPEYQKYLLYGSLAAIVSSIGLGGLIVITLGELSGFWEKAFEGVASITATIVLTYVIVWMSQHARTIKGELEGKIAYGIVKSYGAKTSVNAIIILAFVAVAREGLETVLFLTPLLSIDLGSTLVGSVLGLGVALALSLAAKRGIYNMDISKFFSYTSLILIIFAAGLFGYGIHELIEAAEVSGIESPLFEKAWDINPESKDHPLHEKGIVGSFAKALVGYDGNPEILRVMGYVIYWVIVGSYWRKTFRN